MLFVVLVGGVLGMQGSEDAELPFEAPCVGYRAHPVSHYGENCVVPYESEVRSIVEVDYSFALYGA